MFYSSISLRADSKKYNASRHRADDTTLAEPEGPMRWCSQGPLEGLLTSSMDRVTDFVTPRIVRSSVTA
jgi:hypothetical protein